MENNSTLLNEGITNLIKQLNNKCYNDAVERNNLVLELIRHLQPISKYEIAKKSGLSYGTIKQVCKEFEFCGLVHSKIATGDNGMPVKLIYIEEVKKS